MAKHNINTMQNPEDVKYLVGDILDAVRKTMVHYPTDNNKDYYIQALANLGQRIGIKGDGVAYKHFTFADVLGIDSDIYDSSKYMGVLHYELNENFEVKYQRMGVATKESIVYFVDSKNRNILIEDLNSVRSENVGSRLYINNTEFDVNVNNIFRYLRSSVLAGNGDYFVSALYGRTMGTEYGEKDNTEVLWTKIETETGYVDSAIRVFHLTGEYYAMLTLEYVGDVEHTRKYKLTLYTLNSRIMPTDVYEKFVKNFNDSEYADDSSAMFFKNDTTVCEKTVSELVSYDDTDDSSNTLFGLFAKYRQYEDLENNYQITLQFDTDRDTLLSVAEEEETSNAYYNMLDVLRTDVYGLEGRITAINNDVAFAYPNLIKKYSDEYYNGSQELITQRIVCSLYETISRAEEDDAYSGTFFIPLDMTFDYICNSNNNLNIYYSNDLYVSLTDMSGMTENERREFLDKCRMIIYNYDGVDRISIYNVIVQYNSKYPDYVENINVSHRYTLPYINAQNNWQVNDVNTYVSAMGKDAGNPNIIIVHTSNDGEYKYEIISCSNRNLLLISDWVVYDFKIDPESLTTVPADEHDIYGHAYLPEITTRNAEYLDGSLVINVSDAECIDEGCLDGNFTSLWTLANVDNGDGTKTLRYVCITNTDEDKSGYALDIANLFNLATVITNTIRNKDLLNSNEFAKLLVIDSPSIDFIQSSAQGDTKRYFTLTGTVEDVETESGDDTFNNSTILSIACNDTIDKEDSVHVTDAYYAASERYLDGIGSFSSKNVSQRYKKYQLHEGVITNTENTSTTSAAENYNINEIQSGSLTAATVTQDTLIGGVQSTETTVTTTEEYSYYTHDGEYWDEYVHTQNLPTLELAETVLQDVNVVNRTNILAWGKNGKIYNAYIGSSFNDNNKNVLHIGTSNTNINVGNDTLMSYSYIGKFSRFTDLAIDVDYTYINSYSTQVRNSVVEWQTVGNVTYYTSTIRPIGLLSSYATIWNKDTRELIDGNFLYTNTLDGSLLSKYYAYDTENRTIFKVVEVEGQPLCMLLNLNNLFYSKFGVDISSKHVEITVTDNNSAREVNDYVFSPTKRQVQIKKYGNNVIVTNKGTGGKTVYYVVMASNSRNHKLSLTQPRGTVMKANDKYDFTWYEDGGMMHLTVGTSSDMNTTDKFSYSFLLAEGSSGVYSISDDDVIINPSTDDFVTNDTLFPHFDYVATQNDGIIAPPQNINI